MSHPTRASALTFCAALAAVATICWQAFGRGDPILLASRTLHVNPGELRASPVRGMLELMRGTDVVYVSSDGRYAIAGDLYDLRSQRDLSDIRRREIRRALLEHLSDSQMVVFGPERSLYTVTVFTDVDCPFCRMLHSRIAEYNRLGIRVRYLLFPRSGPDSPSWRRAEQVWCAADRNAALTRAKRGETLDDKPCGHTPVAENFQLAQRMGVTGTPAILLSNGDLKAGYVPPDELAQELKGLAR